MKKLLPVLLVIILALAACSSTTPALTSIMVNQLDMSQASYEAQSKLKIKTNVLEYFGDENTPEDLALILQILEEGLVLDLKQQNLQNTYMKLALENPAPLMESGYWSSENTPELEVYTVENDLYFKTSSEDKFFFLDQSSELAKQGISQVQLNSLNTFIYEAFADYIKQFDFKLREIENKGKTSVSTPAGTKSANHIQVSLNLEDVKDLVSYTLGNLAEYENLDHIAQQYFNMLFADYAEEGYGLTEEEIKEGVNELRALLLEIKDSFDQFDEEELAAALGFKPVLSIDLNYYVTDEAELVKSVMKFDLTLEPFGLPEEVQADPLRFQIESQDVYWNVKGDVELPAFDKEDVYNVLQITSDLQELEKVEEGSVIRQAIEPMAFPRTATIEIGSTWALVNHEYVALEAAPYIKNGNTMVPVSVVTDIAYTEADWDSETKVITFEFDGRHAVVQIGNNKVYVDDKEFEMFVAPEIKNGIAFVPIRLVTKHLGAKIFVYDELGLMDIDY